MAALTFDTGALIRLETPRLHLKRIVEVARRDATEIVVPANCVAEWWRGGRKQTEILATLSVRDVTPEIAKLAGDALAWLGLHREDRIHSGLTVDATVMATAALLGPNVYSGDHDDLARFAPFFPSVRLFGLG